MSPSSSDARLLEGKVAVVTGASRGIGRAIALAFARHGADLVLASRDGEGLEETRRGVESQGRQGLVVPTDLRRPQDVERMAHTALERFGRVDVLVNNSGVGGPTAPLWETSLEDWEETYAVNVTGTFLCCKALLPSMIERRSGSIVIIGSMTGKRPLWGRSPYASGKLALVGLTRTLALEAGPHGIRVNLISPGGVEGERIDWVIRQQAEKRGISVDQARREFVSASPLNRLVPPQDVAAAAVFLASELASSITGEDVNVSAGQAMY